MDPEWLKEDTLTKRKIEFTDTVYSDEKDPGTVRVGEQQADW